MKIKLDHKSTDPLYVQIEKQLRLIIQQKNYNDGEKLPNELDLAQELGVARSTIRQAINNLVIDGLVVRKKSLGTFVRGRPYSSKARNWLSFSQEMALKGVIIRNYELHISWTKVGEEIANFFEIDHNQRVLKLERVRGSKERPFVRFVSYFNPAIGLDGNEDFSIPLYQLLETQFGCIAKTSIEDISALIADQDLSSKLDTVAGSAILQRKRKVYDQEGKPLEWNVGYFRSDSFVYTVESSR